MVSLHAALAFLALSGSGQTVLLDFYADWCGPCHSMDPTVQRLAAAGMSRPPHQHRPRSGPGRPIPRREHPVLRHARRWPRGGSGGGADQSEPAGTDVRALGGRAGRPWPRSPASPCSIPWSSNPPAGPPVILASHENSPADEPKSWLAVSRKPSPAAPPRPPAIDAALLAASRPAARRRHGWPLLRLGNDHRQPGRARPWSSPAGTSSATRRARDGSKSICSAPTRPAGFPAGWSATT